MSDPLCRFVRDASRNGLMRVIAIFTGARPLSTADALRVLACGAADVLPWSDRPVALAAVAARLERWEQVDELMQSPAVTSALVGESPNWRRVLREVVEIAHFTDASLLITGDTGTGKELVARLVHELDQRSGKRKLVVVDCTTVVPTLSGSEFFGHERGAFTGAVSARDGAFALADEGTLFLDEVGELPPELQAELLRVVQEGTYKRVGGNTWHKTHFRLICATNRSLRELAESNQFRWDFYYRIASWAVRLPSLRERIEDIPLLVYHFLSELTSEGEAVPELDPAVAEVLLTHDYPGNVRDLRSLVSRIQMRHVGSGPITLGAVPEEDRLLAVREEFWRDEQFEAAIRRAVALGAGLRQIASAASETAIDIAFSSEAGSVKRAARRLGVTPRALQMRRATQRQRVGQ